MSAQLVNQLRQRLLLSRANNFGKFATALSNFDPRIMKPGDKTFFQYRDPSNPKVFKTLETRLELEEVIVIRGDKQVKVKKAFMVDASNPTVKLDLDLVFQDSGLALKVDADGIPQLDVDGAIRAGKDVEDAALAGGAEPAQAKSMKQAFLDYLQNNPFTTFLQRFRKSRNIADGVSVTPPEGRASSKSIIQNANEVADAKLVEEKLQEIQESKTPEALAVDNTPELKEVSEPLVEMVNPVKTPAGSRFKDQWRAWRSRPPAEQKVKDAVVEPAPVEEKTIEIFVEGELKPRASEAYSKGLVSTRVYKRLTELTNTSSWTNRQKLAAGVGGTLVVAAAVGALDWYLTRSNVAAAVAEHQQDLNGCWMYNRLDGTKTKVKLLSCGSLDLASAIETCTTQSFPSSVITECPTTTFNPCTRDSTSRSTDAAVPLVPNVCSAYVYNTPTAPPAIAGVTLIPACRKEDGTALPQNQSCSPYCKTGNFDLPPYLALMCIDVDFTTAFVDLVSALGYEPETIFPPANATKPVDTSVSKPLLIAAAVLGGVLLVLLGIYWFKK